jgi:RNA polymerase sigma-70 factor, ECF subfamily
MTGSTPSDTDALLCHVAEGNDAALQELLARHRRRLRQMIGVRLDSRLARRVDASDVVQETLLEAARQMPQYVQQRPLPFYPWLRQIALHRLQRLHRQHIQVQRRSVNREQIEPVEFSDQSIVPLAQRLLAGGPSPSGIAMGRESRQQVRRALKELGEADREILVLRFLEQLSPAEIGAVLGIMPGAVRLRQLRALQRLQPLVSRFQSH